MAVTGARPAGAADEAIAAEAVREMFDGIAHRYDLLNHVLSAGVDSIWWRKAARSFSGVLARPEAAVLDICCGTGDLTMALLRLRPSGARPVLAADFSRKMLVRGAQKFAAARRLGRNGEQRPHAIPLEADALRLPLANGSLDLIVTSFGFRNLANYDAGLREFYRALKPGGKLGILEFSEPSGWLGSLYAFYFRRVLPAIGSLICGREGPYSYLPKSVRAFPAPPELLAMMRTVGFEQTAWEPYTFGIAGLYTATKPL